MQLTIEVTSNCQAQCPGCIRKNVINPSTGKHGYTKGVPKNVNMSLEAHNRLIDEASPELTWVSYDGGFGDSPLHPDFLDMIKHVASKPNIEIVAISTNGSYKSEEFWFELGQILSSRKPYNPDFVHGDEPDKLGRLEYGHLVFWDLDGVDNETQNMYRYKTDFDRIIRNAKAYIAGGGYAVWKMIPFDFNEELEERGMELAKEYGFNEFRRTRTHRVEQQATLLALAEKMADEKTDIKEIIGDLNDGEIDRADPKDIEKNIEAGKELIQDIIINPDKSVHQNMDDAKEKAGITCKWADAYGGNYQISHDGSVWRCCWHNSVYQYRTKLNSGDRHGWERFMRPYEDDWNNINTNSFKDIINHRFFIKDLYESFDNKYDDEINPKLKVCTNRCSNLNIPESERFC
jgi:organic radical activating enzyme